MVKMHKLTKGGQTIYPATIYDAVVNPKTRKSLTTEISELSKKINEFNISVLYPTSGVDGSNEYTLAGAIVQVPDEYRTVTGLKITFVNNETSKPETWVYNGGNFTTIDNWIQSNDSEKLDNIENEIKDIRLLKEQLDYYNVKNNCYTSSDGTYPAQSNNKVYFYNIPQNFDTIKVTTYIYNVNASKKPVGWLVRNSSGAVIATSEIALSYKLECNDTIDIIGYPSGSILEVSYSESQAPEEYKLSVTAIKEINFSDEFENVNKRIDNVNDNLYELKTTATIITENQIKRNTKILSTGDFGGSSQSNCFVYDIDDKASSYNINTYINNAQQRSDIGWAFVNDKNSVLKVSEVVQSYQGTYNDRIDIPLGSTKLYVNSYSGGENPVITKYRTFEIGKSIEENEINIQKNKDKIKNITDIQSVVFTGDSTGGNITPILKKYFDSIGVTYYKENLGGQQTPALGAYSGAIPLIAKSSFVIPKSGNVNFTPLSSMSTLAHSNVELHTITDFDGGGVTLPLNPVSIHGVKGNLKSSELAVYGCCLFTNNSRRIAFESSAYGLNINNIKDYAIYNPADYEIGAITKLRVCINAYSVNDVQNASCHVTINDTIVDLIPYITKANTYLNIEGQYVEGREGFYASEDISLSDLTLDKPSDIKTLYMDGLATPVELTFTRLESGKQVIVPKGEFIWSEAYLKTSDSAFICYLNNLQRTDRSLEEDWKYQAEKLCSIAKQGKALFASTHYLFKSNPEDAIARVDALLRDAFGQRYFNGYYYLRDSGLNDAVRYGIYTQEQISGKTWKEIFLLSEENPDVHETPQAGYLLARKFLEMGENLGYWSGGDLTPPSFD